MRIGSLTKGLNFQIVDTKSSLIAKEIQHLEGQMIESSI